MTNLSEFIKRPNVLKNLNTSEITVSELNIDDIFREFIYLTNEKEIEVNRSQMFILVRFVLANGGRYINPNLVLDGKVDSFFGIKLILKEDENK